MYSSNVWVILHCVYVSQLSYTFVCWWTSRLLPCPGYYKQCNDEHWGTCVSFNSDFLSVYAQQRDCWVIWQFYFQIFFFLSIVFFYFLNLKIFNSFQIFFLMYFLMGENSSKWNNWQTTNLKNIQATSATQFQKNKWPNQKMGQRTKQTFLQRRHTDG